LKSDEIDHIFVPNYEGLSLKAMIAFAAEYEDGINYLPEAHEHKRMPRQWVADVLFTVIG